MKAKLGIAPIAWSNDDLPELGGQTSLETCLSEAKMAGFIGVETGGKFPKTSKELRPILDNYEISLCGGWYSGTLLDNDLENEKKKLEENLQNANVAINEVVQITKRLATVVEIIDNKELRWLELSEKQ